MSSTVGVHQSDPRAGEAIELGNLFGIDGVLHYACGHWGSSSRATRAGDRTIDDMVTGHVLLRLSGDARSNLGVCGSIVRDMIRPGRRTLGAWAGRKTARGRIRCSACETWQRRVSRQTRQHVLTVRQLVSQVCTAAMHRT